MNTTRLGLRAWTLLLLPAAGSRAQWPTVETFTMDDGLPTNDVLALAAHPSGRLWILSRVGLSVYDGQSFRPAPEGSLKRDFQQLAIDSRGAVWIAGNRSEGPVQVLEQGRWKTWTNLPESTPPETTALAVIRTSEEPYVVLGTTQGLWIWSDRAWTRFRVSEGLPSDQVHGLAVLGDMIAVATSGGLCWLNAERRQGCAASREDPRLADPIVAVWAARSSSGRLWLLAADWLGFLDPGGLTVKSEGLGLSPELPAQLLVDRSGGVYFGDSTASFFLNPTVPYGPAPSAAKLLRTSIPEPLPGWGVTAFALDRESNIWMGSASGLRCVGSRRFLTWSRTEGLLEDEVQSIVEVGPERYVLGHHGGLSLFSTGEVKVFPLPEHLRRREKFSMSQTTPFPIAQRRSTIEVLDLAVEASGTVWAATRESSLWYLTPDGVFRRHEERFDEETVTLEIDREGRLWVGTSDHLYVRQGGTFHRMEPPEGVSMKNIRRLTSGPDGRLFVSTHGGGLIILDGEDWTQAQGATLPSSFVLDVLSEASGQVWVGTRDGLCEWHGKHLVPKTLGGQQIGGDVYVLLRDPKGWLWIGTNDGIWVWGDNRLRHLRAHQDLVGREIRAGIVDQRGRVWLGTPRGLSVYQEFYDREPEAAPRVELVGFEVNGESRPWDSLDVSLQHHENNLTWRIGMIAFSHEVDAVVRYRLEGFDEDWKGPFSSTPRRVTYNNLEKGRYRLHVVAGWAGGAWGEELTSAWVKIAPPLWIQPWFLILLAATISVIFGVHARSVATLRLRHAEVLQAEINERRRLETEREQLLQEIEAKDVLNPQARQHRLLAQLLRAESPAHLAALRDEVREMEQTRNLTNAHPSDFFAELHRMLESVQALESLPGNDDRAQVLSQALTRVLSMQDQMSLFPGKNSEEPAFGGVALESLRQVFATALESLRQSAELKFALRSKRVTARREAMVVLEIRNAGKGSARNLKLRLTADESVLEVRRGRQHLGSLLSGQSAQVEFAVEPRRSDRVRLAFHVAYDDAERQGKEIDFADVMELRRFHETETSRPLQPNPYVVGRPLLDSDPFFGREEVFARLTTSLQGAGQDNVVVLIGQRRMGKTSMLRRLHRYLPESYVPVLVDLQGLLGTGENAFFSELVGQIVDELAEHGVEVREPPPAAFSADPGGFFRRRFLAEARAALGGRRLLIVFDELEVIEERIRADELTPKILPYLRSLMQHEAGLSFLLAGTHRLDELTADYWGVLFNLAVYLDVGHLSGPDVENLLREPTRESFEIDSLAVDKVYRSTGGHPHFSQLVARELVDYCNREKVSYVTIQDVNQVVQVVADKGQLHIAYLWDGASPDERLLLLAAKELLEHGRLASLEAIERYLAERGVHAGDLAAAARQLRRKQILVEEAGQLSFGIDLLRIWLDRHYGLESFAASVAGSSGAVEEEVKR